MAGMNLQLVHLKMFAAVTGITSGVSELKLGEEAVARRINGEIKDGTEEHTSTPSESTDGTDTKHEDTEISAADYGVPWDPRRTGKRAPPLDTTGPALTDDGERGRVYYDTSKIPGVGRGIFAKWEYEVGDLIVEFCGTRHDDWTKTYSNCKYAVEIKTESGALAYIDGWGIGGAAKIANDALGCVRVPGLVNNCNFQVIGERVFLAATQFIPIGEEILVAYGHDYWYMTPEEYNRLDAVFTVRECKQRGISDVATAITGTTVAMEHVTGSSDGSLATVTMGGTVYPVGATVETAEQTAGVTLSSTASAAT